MTSHDANFFGRGSEGLIYSQSQIPLLAKICKCKIFDVSSCRSILSWKITCISQMVHICTSMYWWWCLHAVCCFHGNVGRRKIYNTSYRYWFNLAMYRRRIRVEDICIFSKWDIFFLILQYLGVRDRTQIKAETCIQEILDSPYSNDVIADTESGVTWHGLLRFPCKMRR